MSLKFGSLLAELVGLPLQLNAVDLASNWRAVRQQLDLAGSIKFLPDAQHDLLVSDFNFHKRTRHFITSAPHAFPAIINVENSPLIFSGNVFQPVKFAAFGKQLSASVQMSLADAGAQCCGSP